MSNRDDPNSSNKNQLRVGDDTLPSVARSLRDNTNGMSKLNDIVSANSEKIG